MTEYAKVVNGVVEQVIVASADFIAELPDKDLYVLTPFNPETGEGKVGIGYTYDAQTQTFSPPAE